MITSVRIRNFKSFRDVEVSLGPFNVLVGPNMSGKSNFVQAFRFIRRICFPAEPGLLGVANAFPGGFHEHTWKGGESNVMAISLRGDNRGSSAHTSVPGTTNWNSSLTKGAQSGFSESVFPLRASSLLSPKGTTDPS